MDATSNLTISPFSQNTNFCVIRESCIAKLNDLGWIKFRRLFNNRLDIWEWLESRPGSHSHHYIFILDGSSLLFHLRVAVFHALLSILGSNWSNCDFISIVSGTLLLVQLLNLAHLLDLGRIKSNSLGCRSLAETSTRHSLRSLALLSALVSPSSFYHRLIILSSET